MTREAFETQKCVIHNLSIIPGGTVAIIAAILLLAELVFDGQ